ncbi:MAG TPA: DinB family protein [Candidatus Angelobacter sp.]|nr:DinB family protein [Candidatus Angelobacter sp.]
MTGRPTASEAAPYYFTYIDKVPDQNIVHALEAQLDETLPLLHRISEEKSLHRYAPGKWNIRELWRHVNDTERLFVFRALWFARGLPGVLPSFDQDLAIAAVRCDELPWASYVDEFREIRQASISFFRTLQDDAWTRSGTASDKQFTVKACAYIVAGHVAHHAAILRDKYL